ncbi:hypothetical protein [uncultured Aquincola sp.]|uniref:hypothetical protein n=1 Tax=uncultured Aquincola sp. TaxID=886556 RepID=UPI0032B16A67
MDLSALIAAAWEQHADDAEATARRIAEMLPQVQAAADVPPFAALLAHVYGEHLGQWPQALALLARLRGVAGEDATAQAAVLRAERTLRCASGDASALDDLSTPDRAAVLAGTAAMQLGRGQTEASAQALDAALALAEGGLPDGSPALRALAVAGNNIAAELQQHPHRSAADTALMLRAAETGLRYWSRAGGWLQVERAEHRLGSCQRAAGRHAEARDSARRCLAVCEANDAPDFERFFAHALLAVTQRDLGDEPGFSAARDAALAHHAKLPTEEQAWCQQELAELQAAASPPA